MSNNFPPPPKRKKASKASKVTFSKVRKSTGHKVVLYGPGGIGKTTLALSAPGAAFFDLDDSLPVLQPGGDTPVVQASTFPDIREALQSDGWDEVKTIVIDSATRAEEMALAYMLRTLKTEKGRKADSIEDYGYGKGYGHLFEHFLPLLGDLDRHCRAGRHVILICHDCATTCPNPMGDDWLRYEPRLQSPNSGKASIRLRVREWADHLLFYGYDVAVKDGKGQGSGTRTLYPAELPHCMAKSRTLGNPIPAPDEALWEALIDGSNPFDD